MINITEKEWKQILSNDRINIKMEIGYKFVSDVNYKRQKDAKVGDSVVFFELTRGDIIYQEFDLKLARIIKED